MMTTTECGGQVKIYLYQAIACIGTPKSGCNSASPCIIAWKLSAASPYQHGVTIASACKSRRFIVSFDNISPDEQ